jgi:hypothetical protein
MKGELGATIESPDAKTAPEAGLPRTRKNKRRSAQGSAGSGPVRFFLSKSDSNGVPNLDREFDSEPEAIVESLKTGKSYFIISEWRGLADVSKKTPLIRKESVSSKKSNSI